MHRLYSITITSSGIGKYDIRIDSEKTILNSDGIFITQMLSRNELTVEEVELLDALTIDSFKSLLSDGSVRDLIIKLYNIPFVPGKPYDAKKGIKKIFGD